MADYSSKEQFFSLLLVLKDYGIIQKLRSIIGDNHSANDKLCYIIAKYLKEEEEIK